MPFVGPASRRRPYLPGPPPREAGSTQRRYPILSVRAEHRVPKVRGYVWLPGPPPSEAGSTHRLYPILQTSVEHRVPKVQGRSWMGRARREAPADPNARQYPILVTRGDDRLPRMRAVRPIWLPWRPKDVPPPPTDRPGGWQRITVTWDRRDAVARRVAGSSGGSRYERQVRQPLEFPLEENLGPTFGPVNVLDWQASRQRLMPRMPSAGLPKELIAYLNALTQWVRDALRENQRNWQKFGQILQNGEIVTNPDPSTGFIIDIRYNSASGFIQVLYHGDTSWTNKISVQQCPEP